MAIAFAYGFHTFSGYLREKVVVLYAFKGSDKQTGGIGFARLRSAIERYSSYSAKLSRQKKNHRENAVSVDLTSAGYSRDVFTERSDCPHSSTFISVASMLYHRLCR